jgi:hypothetical protein
LVMIILMIILTRLFNSYLCFCKKKHSIAVSLFIDREVRICLNSNGFFLFGKRMILMA